jgi:hypothetical protein
MVDLKLHRFTELGAYERDDRPLYRPSRLASRCGGARPGKKPDLPFGRRLLLQRRATCLTRYLTQK